MSKLKATEDTNTTERDITKLQYKPWSKVKQTTFSLSEDGTAIR